MSHECHQDSCSHECHTTGCCSCSPKHHHCGCECHTHHCKYSDDLLGLADEAWMEVVKDKIKEEIIQHSGKHISNLAKIVAEANHARWNYKLSEKKNQEEYEEQLRSLMLRQKK